MKPFDTHSFSVAVACVVGVNAAIVIQHIRFLQISMKGSGEYWDIWVKRSRAALLETYPYLSDKEIRGVLESLVKGGYLIAKEGEGYDRTKSYRLSAEGMKLCGCPHWPKGPIHFTDGANAIGQKGQSIGQKGQSTYNYNTYNRNKGEVLEIEVFEPPITETFNLVEEEENPTPPYSAAPPAPATIAQVEAEIVKFIKENPETIRQRHELMSTTFDGNAERLAALFIGAFEGVLKEAAPAAYFLRKLPTYLGNKKSFTHQNARFHGKMPVAAGAQETVKIFRG